MLSLPAAAAGETGSQARWIEVFGSSPAAYVMSSDATAQMQSLAKPRPVTGTIRMSLTVSAGGEQLRVRFSNEASDAPLVIGAASVALADAAGAPSGRFVSLSFGGKPTIVVPAGSPALSDPIALPTRAMDNLVVSLFTPGTIPSVVLGGARMTLAPGNQVLAARMENASRSSPGRS
jgi:hypothetical protein